MGILIAALFFIFILAFDEIFPYFADKCPPLWIFMFAFACIVAEDGGCFGVILKILGIISIPVGVIAMILWIFS